MDETSVPLPEHRASTFPQQPANTILDDGEQIRVICIPTEAGTHFPSQKRAPQAIITAGGLETKLKSAGFRISIHDNVIFSDFLRSAATWKPSALEAGVRNEDNAIAILTAIKKDLVTNHVDYQTSSFPIVLGGDSSITPAVLSGLREWHPIGTKVGLVYFNGNVDLALPSQNKEGSAGILDTMTMTHLTARPGSLKRMRDFDAPGGLPLINSSNVVFFGFDPKRPSTEHWVYLLENGFKALARPTVQQDPLGSVQQALQWLDARTDVMYLSFDVSCINSGSFPLANLPHYAGLEPDAALMALGEFLCHRKVKGFIITGVNPSRDPDGAMVSRLVDGIVEGLKMRRVPDTEFTFGSSCTF